MSMIKYFFDVKNKKDKWEYDFFKFGIKLWEKYKSK